MPPDCNHVGKMRMVTKKQKSQPPGGVSKQKTKKDGSKVRGANSTNHVTLTSSQMKASQRRLVALAAATLVACGACLLAGLPQLHDAAEQPAGLAEKGLGSLLKGARRCPPRN